MSNHLEIDGSFDRLVPWKLEISFGDQVFKVRPLSVGDVAVLQKIGTNPSAELEKVITFLESIFETPKPDVRAWSLEVMTVVVMHVWSYIVERKNENMKAAQAAFQSSRGAATQRN